DVQCVADGGRSVVAVRQSDGATVRPSRRSYQASRAAPSACAQAPGGADGHAPERAPAGGRGDAQGAGRRRAGGARRGRGARPGRPPRSRHLHDDDAAAGGGPARGARDRGRGGVPGPAAQQPGGLRRGAGVAVFYRAAYRPNAARLLVVGDVTLVEVRRLLAARLGAWEQGPVPAVPEATPPVPAARTVYLVDKPGAAQSVIRIGHVGVARTTPDYFALQVLNTILGGAFTSRLNQNLRETHGYTYGAFSQFSAGRLAGPFVASASVVTAKTDSSLIEFLKELRRIRDEPVPDPELAKAKAY